MGIFVQGKIPNPPKQPIPPSLNPNFQIPDQLYAIAINHLCNKIFYLFFAFDLKILPQF